MIILASLWTEFSKGKNSGKGDGDFENVFEKIMKCILIVN
jgi:hypothetical protein